MGGYTRILPTGKADELVEEIPTFVSRPLNKSIVKYGSYDLLNRPYGMLQWAYSTNATEDFVLIEESDHILMKALPNMMVGNQVTGSYFWYMHVQVGSYCCGPPSLAQALCSS